MMENNIKVRHNPHQRHRAHLKKSTRYKDSLSKYKDTIPKLIQKQTIIPTQERNESKINIKNLRKGHMEFKDKIRKKEIPSIFSSTEIYGWRTNQRYSFSAPKNHFLRVNTPKRNYLRREKNINHTLISLYHSHIKNDEFNEEIIPFEKKAWAKAMVVPQLPDTCMTVQFSHIMAGGYAAGYYSYKWAEVLDADAFAVFKKHGIFDQATAQSFRDNILSKGGTENPMVLYKRFKGGEPTIDALLKRNGIKTTKVR